MEMEVASMSRCTWQRPTCTCTRHAQMDESDSTDPSESTNYPNTWLTRTIRRELNSFLRNHRRHYYRQECKVGNSSSILFLGITLLLLLLQCFLASGMGLGGSSSVGGGSEVNSLSPSSPDHGQDHHHDDILPGLDNDNNNAHHLSGNHVREPIPSEQQLNAISRRRSGSSSNGNNMLHTTHLELYGGPHHLHNHQLLNFTMMLRELDQGCSAYCADQIQFNSICVNKGCRNWKTGLREGCSFVCNGSENNVREFYACQIGCSKAIEDYYIRVTGLIGVPDPPTLISDSLKSSSLRLSWEGSALPLPYLVFTVQRRVPRRSQWETIPSSSQQPLNTTTFTVQSLKPYTEYQFRIGWILTHDSPPYYSRESNPIETLPKGLPNPPEITSIQPISNTSVSVTWLQPSQPNGRLIAYILKLRKLPNGHVIIKEIPISQNPKGYTFTGLQPITNYSLEISAQNVEGEGNTAKVNFVTPQSSMSNDISEKPEPRLLLQGIKDVYIQHLDLFLDPDVFVYNSSQNISATACHYKYKWVFIATGEGDIIRAGLDDHQNKVVVPKERLDLVISYLAVDWLHNQLYIVGKKRHSSNWSIKKCDLNGNSIVTVYPYLFEKPLDFAADPYTGYLYWVKPSSQSKRGGLFKMELNADEFLNGLYPVAVIDGQDLGPFVVDSVNYRILVVHKSRNTVLAVSLDGDVTDIRQNTQSPQFETALSIAWYNGIFYWTTGQSIVIEEYNAAQDSYYQNLYDVAKVHQPCSRLMVVHPDLQPTPVPMAPPQRVQVIYGQTRARVSWRPPPVISGLGDAAWREWRYQLRLVETNVSYVNVSGSEFIIENLRPSTYYSVQVAASSDSGRGPWAPPVRGKTLRESQYNITFLWGSQSGLFATNTLGENVELLASPSIWLNESGRGSRGNEKSVELEQSTSQPGLGQVGNVYMSSLTWFDSLVFFALSNGSVYYYDTVTNYPANLVYEGPKRNEVTKLTGVPHAESIAFDYIGQKLYWSNPSEQEIRRCSFIKGSVGNRNSLAVNVETVNPCSLSEKAERLQMVTRAREIAVDSYKGMLLWSTEHSLEISTLNGYSPRTLYQTPGLFSGIHIMAITLDTIQSRIYWISRSSRGSTVQSLRYSIQSPQPPMIIAEYDDTSITGPIRYFNDRLIWLQGPSEAVIKDLSGDSKSSLRISSINNITNIHVRDQSAQRYPRGLSRRKIQVYPDPILKWTISLQGKWNNFSINWTPVNNTNFGSIQYEVVVNNSISKITPYANITIDNVASFKPYTDLEIVITSLTSWASSKPIMVRLKTPSWRPSEPLNPRVFVQKLGYPYAQTRVGSNLSTGGASSVSAEFRWDPPESPNGLILGYLIHSWKDTLKTMERSCDVDMSKPQYPRCAVENLASGSKYYFAIQAFTETGAGNMSSKVLVDTSFNTPVPRVMLVTSDQLQILDIDRNSLEAIPLGYLSPMTAAHFTSEDTVFWFNEGQDLMWSKVGSVNKTRILSLSGQAEASNLVVDWTGRKLYWAYEYTSAGAVTLEEKYGIMSLDLVPNWHIPQTPSVVISSKTPVRSVTVNPFRKGLFWTTARRNGITTLLASETNGSSPRPFLSRDQANCNCSGLSSTGDPIAYDPHGLGRSSAFPSGILFVDKQSIWLSDDNGCNCVRLVTFSTLPFLQNTPYRIAGDEHRVYWTGGFLYASEKLGNGGVTELQPIGAGVREVSVYGPDSQPFPELSCLIPQRMEPMEPHLSNHSSHSLHLELPRPVTVNCSLGEVSLPTTKYDVYYGTVNENGISECTPTSSSFCKVVTTLESMLHITDLHPYTTYTVFVTLTNYYAEQQGEKPLGCSPIMLRTAPGAPMPPTLLRLEPRTPMSVRVVWRQPEKLNGEKVWYEVYWKSVGAREHNGQKWAETETRSNYDRTEYYLDLVDLLPESNYTIWVIAFSEKGDAFSESERKAVTTFGHPNNITLVKASPHSLRISWVPPNDTSILRHQIMYRDGWSSQWNLTELVDFTIPNKTYEMNITNLKPKTSYGFRIQTWYIGDPKTGLVWPKEDQFNFETLADKPGKPGKPVARGIGRSIYEVTWEKAAENGAVVEVYSLECKMEVDTSADLGADSGNQSLASVDMMNMTTPSIGKPRRKRDWVEKANQADAEKLISLDADMRDEPLSEWVVIYNGTDARWQVEELDINKPYSFRVRAKNMYGWGEYSLESVSISLAELTLLPQEAQGFGIILGSIFLACLTLGTCALLTLFLYRGKLKEKPILSGTVSSERREVELATLRELPGGSTFIHQSNFLYARDLLVDVDLASITKVHMQQISFTKFLGSGAFGEVYEGIVSGLENPHEDTRVAIKTLRKGASSLEKLEFIQEAKLMVHFQHPHIIQLLGLCVDTDPCCLLLELMSGGDLLSYLRSHRPNLSSSNSLTILDLIRMCVDVAKGCVYLEEMHFVHRDLAARNCLVQIETALGGEDSRSGSVCRRVVKIGDFGLARDIYRNDYYRKDGEGLLPVRWMSPESLVDGVFTTQSDVWAFGVLLWEIMTLGQQPYPARNNQEVLQYVRGGGRLNLPHHCPQSLSQLMLRCWEYNSDNRPSFRECHAELEATLQTYESILIIAQPSAEVTHSSTNNATSATIPDKEEEDEYGFCSTNADVHRYHYRRESAPKYIEVIADSGESSEPVSPLRGGVNEGYEVPLPRKPPRRKLPENHSYSSSQSSHSPLEYGLPQPKYWNVDTSSSSQNFQRSNSTSSNIPLLHKSSSTSAEKRNQAFMQDSMEDVQYAEVTSPEEEEASIYSKSSSVNDTPLGYHVMGGGAGDGEQANGVKFPVDNCQVSLNESPIYTYSYTMPSSTNLAGGGLDYHHHRVASSMNAPGFNRQTIDTCGSG